MATKRAVISSQISNKLRADFLESIKDEFNGPSDFFRRRINEKCAVEKTPPQKQTTEHGYSSLNVSVSPEQRAALLTQCEKEGKTMGTWMREQILEYLKSKGETENE